MKGRRTTNKNKAKEMAKMEKYQQNTLKLKPIRFIHQSQAINLLVISCCQVETITSEATTATTTTRMTITTQKDDDNNDNDDDHDSFHAI